jgi:peptidoglycan hydrolase-like protein with peptidoglycan-binding domain
MKQAVGAAVALTFALGLVASAQAAGVHRQSTAPNMQNGSTQQMQQSRINPQRLQKIQRLTSKQSVRQLQQKLRAEGLYRGRVDGIVGPKTRHAMAAAQQRTRTAKLHQRNRQTGNQEIGVGSSTPTGNANQQMMPQTNQAPNNQNLNYNQNPTNYNQNPTSTQPQNQ